MKNQKKTVRTSSIVINGLLIVAALAMIIPFYWMLNTALKSLEESNLTPPTYFPKELHFSNFTEALKYAPFARFMFNTLFVGVVNTVGTLITTIFAAYAFAKLEFKGKHLLFAALLATMMIPGEMMVITNYLTIARLGWLNSYKALIVPFMVSVFYIFLLRNNFKQIPNELYLSAKVDGTNDFKYLFRVMVPMAKPTIISIMILNMLSSWNAYVWPNLVTESDNLKMVTNGLRNAFKGEDGFTEFHLQMAAAFMVTLPVLIIFLVFKQYIMKGTASSGVKG